MTSRAAILGMTAALVAGGAGHGAHATPAGAAPQKSPYRPVSVPKHAQNYYELYRGVDNLRVRRTASGNLLRFSFRVVHPEVAKVLGDKNATPYLLGQRSHVLLEIPVMDKIGQLRQTGQFAAGQEYWMLFSNKGNLIKAGDRVSILIGAFHIDGLVVE